MKEKGKAIASPSLYQIETEERFRDKISNFYPADIEKTTVPSTSLLRSHMDTARHVVSYEEVDPGDAESLKGFWVCGKCFGPPKVQASKSPKCDFIKGISPDPLLISSQEDQIFVPTSPNSYTETELENMMRMESNLPTANGGKELIISDFQHTEVRDEVSSNSSKKKDYGSNEKDEGDQGEKSKGHMIIFEEPMPLQMEEPLSEKEIEDRATLWVQSNVLEFSRRFGAAFEGCDKIAFELLMKIDQKRGYLDKKEEATKKEYNQNSVPKELRNLEFHMNFKDGEPRGRGRTTPLRLK
uniref:Putative ovule protein n=1 Tax=Solanum chacoense TaxID=4108 RepID=A0A0V0I714_SOLCH